MTNLATKADLEDFSQSTSLDDGQALLLLTACSDAVRNYTGQLISAVAADVIWVYGNDKVDVTLPEQPVTAVAEVLEVLAGQETADGAVLEADVDYMVPSSGVLKRLDGGSWIFGAKYRVTYDHGYAVIPAPIILAVCRMATKLMANPTASGPVQSESIGDYSYTLASAASGAQRVLTDEMSLLAPYRTQGLA